jgi:hypothetical protein
MGAWPEGEGRMGPGSLIGLAAAELGPALGPVDVLVSSGGGLQRAGSRSATRGRLEEPAGASKRCGTAFGPRSRSAVTARPASSEAWLPSLPPSRASYVNRVTVVVDGGILS